MSKCHLVIPDAHAQKGDKNDRAIWLGRLICDLKPDTVVDLGDSADMPSLCSYDKGTKSFEGRRYKDDINAYLDFQDKLWSTVRSSKKRLPRNRVRLIGNHEQRIERAVNNDSKLEGLIKYEDLPYSSWEVYPFLQPVFIDNIAYCHYFPTGIMGRPTTSATAMVSKLHMSCIAGHQQGKQIAYAKRPDGSVITCIIAGSCYEHNETYLDIQSNNYWRGIIMLHEVNNGSFDEMFVSLKYLKEKYE